MSTSSKSNHITILRVLNVIKKKQVFHNTGLHQSLHLHFHHKTTNYMFNVEFLNWIYSSIHNNVRYFAFYRMNFQKLYFDFMKWMKKWIKSTDFLSDITDQKVIVDVKHYPLPVSKVLLLLMNQHVKSDYFAFCTCERKLRKKLVKLF